jgi:hypothetical protein
MGKTCSQGREENVQRGVMDGRRSSFEPLLEGVKQRGQTETFGRIIASERRVRRPGCHFPLVNGAVFPTFCGTPPGEMFFNNLFHYWKENRRESIISPISLTITFWSDHEGMCYFESNISSYKVQEVRSTSFRKRSLLCIL